MWHAMKRKFCGDVPMMKRQRGEAQRGQKRGYDGEDLRAAKHRRVLNMEMENASLMAENARLRNEISRLEMVLAHYIRSMSAPTTLCDSTRAICCN